MLSGKVTISSPVDINHVPVVKSERAHSNVAFKCCCEGFYLLDAETQQDHKSSCLVSMSSIMFLWTLHH